jgi:hypothetical protein
VKKHESDIRGAREKEGNVTGKGKEKRKQTFEVTKCTCKR